MGSAWFFYFFYLWPWLWRSPDQWIWAVFVFLNSLQSVLRGGEVSLFSHSVVFILRIFENGYIFVIILYLWPGPRRSPDQWIWAGLVFLNSLQSVLRGGEVSLFSHSVVFRQRIFENGYIFVIILYLWPGPRRSPDQWIWAGLVFLYSLQSVLWGGEVSLFSHSVVFMEHLFENGYIFVIILYLWSWPLRSPDQLIWAGLMFLNSLLVILRGGEVGMFFLYLIFALWIFNFFSLCFDLLGLP